MSNLNTNYENMKKYKFETLFIKKSNLNMKIPVWNMTYEKYQAPLSAQGHCAVFVPGCLGPLWTETLAQVASVGKTSRFWDLRASEREGFKGEWTRRLWGRINTRNIEGRGNAGSFRANEWRNAVGLRGIESEEIWRRVNAIEWGEMQGVSQQKQGVLEQTSEGTQWVWGESNVKEYGGRMSSLIY